MRFVNSLTLLFLLGACKNSPNGGWTTGPIIAPNSMVKSFHAFEKSIKKFNQLQLGGDLSTPPDFNNPNPAFENPFGTDWQMTDFLFDPSNLNGNQNVGFSTWIKNILSAKSFANGSQELGALRNMKRSLELFCVSGVLLGSENTDENDYPKVGDYTGDRSIELNIKKAIELSENCGFFVNNESIGKKYSIKVLKPELTISNDYERHIQIDLASLNNKESGEIFNFYYKDDKEIVNFASIYNGDKIIRELANVEKSRDITRYEYIAGPQTSSWQTGGITIDFIGPPGTYTLYRMLYDGTRKEASLIGDFKHKVPANPFETENFQRFSVTAQEDEHSQNELSLSTLFASSANNPQKRLREACLNSRNSTLITDGQRCLSNEDSLVGYSADSLRTLNHAISHFNKECKNITGTSLLNYTSENFHTAKFSCTEKIKSE